MSGKNNLKSIQELLGFTFKIETYQRGYRWDIAQVLNLLDDIDEYSKKNHSDEPFYCLQPLVVKQDNVDLSIYELIDGQQRTTSIHLVLMCLNSENFEINYTTRNTSNEGENSFIKSLKHLDIIEFELSNDIDGHKSINKTISKKWKEITQDNNDINTVDNFYLYRAYCVIVNWFKAEERSRFLSTLLTETKVIWYEEDKTSSKDKVVKKFIDFNEGKIELEQAELIKALFVLDILKLPNPIQRQYEENKFANDWNLIEYQLSDPKFWQFISNNKNDETIANKINLVFQLYNDFGKDEDKYYNYRKLENEFRNSEKTDNNKPKWESITNLYNGLEEWYFDRTTYHLCGTIIHLTGNNISTILQLAEKSLTKQDFRSKLRSEITSFFFNKNAWKNKYDPDLISYNNSKEVAKVLFLFNIALTQVDEKDSFFPFHRFYNVKQWNIEHILAKNDDGLKEKDEFENFSEVVKELVKSAVNEEDQAISAENLNVIKKLIQELDALIPNKKQCGKKVKEINEKLYEIFEIDDFNNLCLLDQSTNIKVGKRPFKEKRDITLKLSEKIKLAEEAYLPIGTQLVFSKRATPSNDYQPNYWSFKDRMYYLEKVDATIREFLNIQKNGN